VAINYARTMGCMESNTKQCEEHASADFTVLRPQLFPFSFVLQLGKSLLYVPYPLHRTGRIIFLVGSGIFL
jgi:hypothetical protein